MSSEVTLRTGEYCIEAAARKEFRLLMDSFFEIDDVYGELDEKIELIRDFLEKSDFNKLRASDPRLSGEKESLVVISRKTSDTFGMSFIEI